MHYMMKLWKKWRNDTMVLENEEKDILKLLVFNELDYYERLKEDYDELDYEYIQELKKILSKLERNEK